jgi:hypothetical protein
MVRLGVCPLLALRASVAFHAFRPLSPQVIFWCWQIDERPVALQKIEFYDRDDEDLRWFYCFASASPNRLQPS